MLYSSLCVYHTKAAATAEDSSYRSPQSTTAISNKNQFAEPVSQTGRFWTTCSIVPDYETDRSSAEQCQAIARSDGDIKTTKTATEESVLVSLVRYAKQSDYRTTEWKQP